MALQLDKQQLYHFITDNKYITFPKYVARDLDGRYANSRDLPAIAIPGGDVSDLAVLYATSIQYAFSCDPQKVLETLIGLVGDVRSIAIPKSMYWEKLQKDPASFGLHPEDVSVLHNQVKDLHSQGANTETPQGEHHEGAVLLVRGEVGILPQWKLAADQGNVAVQAFIYNQTLVNERHKQFAKLLIENNAVQLYDNLDKDYLYQVFSDTFEDHFWETMKHVAADLPIYEVDFQEDGSFIIEDRGFVQS